MLHCPNCGAPTESVPLQCGVCGYSAALIREYFWIYAGGALILCFGLAMGAIGIIVEGAAPGHWSRAYCGWLPLAPWPERHHWLSFLIVGIGLTLGGLGITRHQAPAWLLVLVLTLHALVWTALAMMGLAGGPTAASRAALPLLFEAGSLALLLRIGLALRRTPPRDPKRLQEALRQQAGGGES